MYYECKTFNIFWFFPSQLSFPVPIEFEVTYKCMVTYKCINKVHVFQMGNSHVSA